MKSKEKTHLFPHLHLPESYVERVLPVVHQGNGFPVGIVVEGRLQENAVAVASHHDVDISCAGNETLVVDVDVRHLPAKMRKADDNIAAFLFAQLACCLVGCADGVEVGDSLVVFLKDESFKRRCYTEDANPHAFLREDGIGLDASLETGALDIVVGAKDGERGKREEALHVFFPAVELVVPYRSGIVAHSVHQAHFRFAVKEGVVEGALRVVAAVEEQQVLVDMLAQAVDECGAPYVAAQACLAVGLDAAVRVARLYKGKGDFFLLVQPYDDACCASQSEEQGIGNGLFHSVSLLR